MLRVRSDRELKKLSSQSATFEKFSLRSDRVLKFWQLFTTWVIVPFSGQTLVPKGRVFFSPFVSLLRHAAILQSS